MNRQEAIRTIVDSKIIVVVRGIYGRELLRLADALTKGGSRHLR